MEGHLIALGLIVIIFLAGQVFSDNTCNNDWAPYKDEKCLKIFDTELNTYEGAQSFCKQKYDADLVSIGFEEKQKFVEDFLKSAKIADYVWIGLKYESDNNYVWSDGENFVYSNWESGSPKNNPDYCVQMSTDDAEFGKWVDVLCTKKNLVLCEKVQPWSMSQLQNEFMNLKKNLMPVGFTYVQLPKDAPPADLWPWMTWKDVSSEYDSLFFRVQGKNSSSFGTIQEQGSPKITYIDENDAYTSGQFETSINIYPNNKLSKYIGTGAAYNPGEWTKSIGLAFQQSDEEVRPCNMAIRIWKRTQ